MTRLQRGVLLLAVALMVCSASFPPWVDDEGSFLGHGWLFDPPQDGARRRVAPDAALEYLRQHPDSIGDFHKKYGYLPREFRGWLPSVDIRLLLVEWAGILIASILCYLATLRVKKTSSSSSDPQSHQEHANRKRDLEIRPSSFLENQPPLPAITESSSSLRGHAQGHDAQQNASTGGIRRGEIGIGRAYLTGFVVVVLIALGSFLWREVKRAAPPPSPVDLCQFAANSAMLEQWLLADGTLDPLKAAQHLFGSDAKRRWTVETAETFGDKANSLRQLVSEDARTQAAIRSWLQAVKTDAERESRQREHVRRLLIKHCQFG